MKNSKPISLDEFIHRVRDSSNSEFTLAKSRVAIDSLVAVLKEMMMNGEYIAIKNFGSIGSKMVEGHIGRNPNTMEEYKVPRRLRPFFEASDSFKREIWGK